jgi:hypothetical protein
MADKKEILEALGRYLLEHPEEALRALRNAIAFRIGVPLDALRWFAARARGPRAPKDVQIEAAPPGVRFSATVNLMGTAIRASAELYIERVNFGDDALRVEVRLAGVALTLLDPGADSPIAALLKSGALDLSKPGNLVAYMPKRPAVLVEAKDDRIVLDLFKHPKLAKNARAQRIAALIEPLLRVEAVQTDEAEHLDVRLRPFPQGVGYAFETVRRHL